MPELPELEVVRERLGPRLVGRRVTDVHVSRRFGFLLRSSPAELAGAMRDRRVSGWRRRGKYILLQLDEVILVVNPMLGGRFAVVASAGRAADSVLLRVALEDGEELRLSDSARMARVYLAAADTLDAVPGFAELGPEADAVELPEWRARIRRHPGELKNLLRNQAFVSGVGNAYSDEILFSAQLLPLRRRSSLQTADVDRLWEATLSTLRDAIGAIRAQTGYVSEKQDRSFMRVHLRGGQTCVRCGHRVSELTARGEVTSFCRGCQF